MKFIIFQGPFEVLDVQNGDEVEDRLQELFDEKDIYATAIRIEPEEGLVFGFSLNRPVISTPWPVEELE